MFDKNQIKKIGTAFPCCFALLFTISIDPTPFSVDNKPLVYKHYINKLPLVSDAIASGESVRLAPSLRSQKGAIWSKQGINFDWWEVDIMFKVTGRGRIGADGLVSTDKCCRCIMYEAKAIVKQFCCHHGYCRWV